MKKIIVLLSLIGLSASVFGVDFKLADKQAANKAGYEADLAYVESLTGIAEGETYIKDETLEQYKIVTICNIKLSAFHFGKDAAFCEKARAEAKELFYANVAKLSNRSVFQLAMRVNDYQLAASKFGELIKVQSAPEVINNAVALYKNGAISKDVAVAALMEASVKEIKVSWYASLSKAVANIPTRGLDGKAFMSREQKKEFYGNFIELNSVTAESADFLGACVTQFNLVK